MRKAALAALVALIGWAAAMTGAAATAGHTVRFESTDYTGRESQGVVALTVVRDALSLGASTVDFHTIDGTAVAGRDYRAEAGTLTFAVGQASRTIQIGLIDDHQLSSRRSFTVTLSNPTGDTDTTGGPAVVAIEDDDTAPAASAPSRMASPAAGSGAAVVISPPAPAGPVTARDARVVHDRAYRSGRNAPALKTPPVVPFSFEHAGPGSLDPPEDTAGTTLLAVVAALLLARVGAEVWFRWRMTVEPLPYHDRA